MFFIQNHELIHSFSEAIVPLMVALCIGAALVFFKVFQSDFDIIE